MLETLVRGQILEKKILNEINLGLYDLSSDTMQWNNNKLFLIITFIIF